MSESAPVQLTFSDGRLSILALTVPDFKLGHN
ncbi:hypothetical protein [Caudoviricetes sp.]|nr:hypothetical protein [Caudoviricetes sp.]